MNRVETWLMRCGECRAALLTRTGRLFPPRGVCINPLRPMPLTFHPKRKRYEISVPHGCQELLLAAGFKWDATNRHWWSRSENVAARLLGRARMDRQLQDKLQKIADFQRESAALSGAVEGRKKFPAPKGLSYYPFQEAGIEYLCMRKDSLLADEMGTGKSIQSLGYINAKRFKKVLVVCPASLRINWRREAEKWLVEKLRTVVITGSNPKGLGRSLYDDSLFVVISYGAFSVTPRRLKANEISDILGSNEPIGRLSERFKLKVDDIAYIRRYKKQRDGLVERLLEVKWDLLLGDEGHYLKSRNSKRTVAFKRLASQVPRRLILTGTPVPNRVWEIWQLLNILAPDEYSRFHDFLQRYCDGQQQKCDDPHRAKFLNELIKEELQQIRLRPTLMVRRMKRDVLKDLPPKIVQIVELGAEQFKKELAEERKAEQQWKSKKEKLEKERDSFPKDSEGYKAAVQKLNVAQGIHFTELSRVRHLMAVAKAPDAADHIADLLDDYEGKIAVWLHHKDVADIVIERLASYGVVTVLGKDSAAHRQESVDRFASDDSVRVVVGSILAAGVGLSLPCGLACFVELDWTPGNVSQAEDRHHGIGRTVGDSLLIQYIVVDGSLDAKMAKTLVEKQEQISAAVDADEEPEPKAEISEQAPISASSDEAKQTILLVDALPVLLRSYYAGVKQDDGLPHGLYGLFYAIHQAIAKLQPEYCLIALDSPGKTFRHQMHPEYKANREPLPDDALEQIEAVRDAARAFGIPCIGKAGYEADDIVGTLSRLAAERGVQSVMLSTDKDLYQLIDDSTFMLKPDMDFIDVARVEELLPGVSPDTMTDYLALCGDRSDNIPGCKGIGDSWARQYVAQFGSVEALLQRKGEVLPDGKREAIYAHEEEIVLSKRLATIFRKVPIELPLRAAELKDAHTVSKADLEEFRLEGLLDRFGEFGQIRQERRAS